jgi:formylglycine-generating enzyme required for sulfatase activity
MARSVTARLPESFRFAGMATHTLGDQTHTLAFFDRDGARFALIPGGEVTLGYDPATFVPSPGQIAAMDEMREYFAEDEEDATLDLPTYLVRLASRGYEERFLTPVRRATIAPFLLEAQTAEAGVFPVPAEEYLTAAQIASFRRHPGIQAEMVEVGSGQDIRVLSGGDDTVRVFINRHPTHAKVVAELAHSGFRLPSSDEWEYACGAGTRTLFRWGDDCPLRRLPMLDYEDEPDSTWDLHDRPNAFGLRFSGNPYDWEICDEPGLMRGGDGGAAICGGEGTVAAWTALATAFAWRWEDDELYGAHVRRAYSLL